MAQDWSLAIRRAILPHLKGDDVLTALIPVARIYPATVPANPALPFIRYGASIAAPFLASGLDSSAITVAVHAFTGPVVDDNGAETKTAEDAAASMSNAIGKRLDNAELPLDDTYKARITWTGSNLLRDPDDADLWHAVVNIRAEVSG